MKADIAIREAVAGDYQFVVGLMNDALAPFYGGDHAAHAERIFNTHTSGGRDRLGFFSHEQKMFIAEKEGERAGIVHVVGKRQGTYKISPLIVSEKFRSRSGIGSALLDYAECYAKEQGARQIYCTVALENSSAFQFFLRKGYTVAGRSDSHYKPGITESMLYNKDVVTQQWSLDIMGENVMRIMRLKQRFLDQVRKGEKTLEVRVGYPQIKSIRLGERIRFMSRTETQDVSVKGIREYAGFEVMLAHENGERVVPGLPHDDLLRLLQEIYPPSKEHLGVVVLEIEPVQSLHHVPVLSGQP